MKRFGFAEEPVKNTSKSSASSKQREDADEEESSQGSRIIMDMTVKLIKICLAIYFANFKKIGDKRKSLSRQQGINAEEVGCRLKNLNIEYLLRKLITLEVEGNSLLHEI